MTFLGPSVPPVMSTQILPARADGLLLPTYGPAPLCAAIRYSGISSRAFCTSSMSFGSRSSKYLDEEVDHEVVGRRVRREERDVEQAGDVDRLIVVDRHHAPLDLVHALADELLARLDRHAELRPDVGLDFHDVVQLREAVALGVMRVDGVDRHALLAQPVGEQDLAAVHVDAAEQGLDLGLGVADVDARVGERVRQVLRVGELLEVVGRLLVPPAGTLEVLVDALLAARVGLDAHAHGGLVDLAKLHGGPFCSRRARTALRPRTWVGGDARGLFIPETRDRRHPVSPARTT